MRLNPVTAQWKSRNCINSFLPEERDYGEGLNVCMFFGLGKCQIIKNVFFILF